MTLALLTVESIIDSRPVAAISTTGLIKTVKGFKGTTRSLVTIKLL